MTVSHQRDIHQCSATIDRLIEQSQKSNVWLTAQRSGKYTACRSGGANVATVKTFGQPVVNVIWPGL